MSELRDTDHVCPKCKYEYTAHIPEGGKSVSCPKCHSTQVISTPDFEKNFKEIRPVRKAIYRTDSFSIRKKERTCPVCGKGGIVAINTWGKVPKYHADCKHCKYSYGILLWRNDLKIFLFSIALLAAVILIGSPIAVVIFFIPGVLYIVDSITISSPWINKSMDKEIIKIHEREKDKWTIVD